ncbi:MAG: PorT family protein [Dysgonamonadaceae bacterium]|jgi:hypothetical protein|nr:PorT family protein [Dysgonamonadaceae bacterium]
MKKLATLLCIACITASVTAQSSVRIGNMEIIVRKSVHDRDTVLQVAAEEPDPPCPQENEPRSSSRTNPYAHHVSSFFTGIGLILPDNSNDYYTVLGGNSIGIDAGWIHRYQLSRRFALGGTLHYSYSNYKLRNAAEEPAFMEEVIGRPFVGEDIAKQTYRCHAIAAGAYTRFYLVAPRKYTGNDGMYIDLGAQGDFAFSKYYKLKTNSRGKYKYRDSYAFNPFTASAIARIGWKRYAVFARYRFTDAFNSKVLPADLPPLTVGIQFF